MDNEQLKSLMNQAAEVARAAGAAILEITSERMKTRDKDDGSPVTEADLASNRAMQQGLEAIEPRLPIVSEESDPEAAAAERPEVFWLVDPLDGTKEFVAGIPEYTVNIALVRGGDPLMGVVYIPAAEVMYTGIRGLGAWKATGDGDSEAISASDADRPVRAVVSRSHLDDKTREFLDSLGITDRIPHGSSLKMCAVADGSADIYPRFGPTCLWDTAAGAAVARAAGCKVTDLDGNDLSYDPAGGIKHAGFLVYPEQMAATVEQLIG
ncbi:MAG: 3'(2'),5'-bisphosphate nucleotidase CysQ [Phycisphaerae bacterium]